MSQQSKEKEQRIIEHVKKFMGIVWPGESFRKVFERYEMDWTPDLINRLELRDWVFLWDKLCRTEQKRADTWIIELSEGESESEENELVETTV